MCDMLNIIILQLLLPGLGMLQDYTLLSCFRCFISDAWFIRPLSPQVLFPELGLDLVEGLQGEEEEEEHSLALSLSSWQVIIVIGH